MISGRVAVVAAGGREGGRLERDRERVEDRGSERGREHAPWRRHLAGGLGAEPGAEAAPDSPGPQEDGHRRERAERKAGTVHGIDQAGRADEAERRQRTSTSVTAAAIASPIRSEPRKAERTIKSETGPIWRQRRG